MTPPCVVTLAMLDAAFVLEQNNFSYRKSAELFLVDHSSLWRLMDTAQAARKARAWSTRPAPTQPAPTDLPAIRDDVPVTASHPVIQLPGPSTILPASVNGSDESGINHSVAMTGRENSRESESDPPGFKSDGDDSADSSPSSDSGYSADPEMPQVERVDESSLPLSAHESSACSDISNWSADTASDTSIRPRDSDVSSSSDRIYADSYVETLMFPDKGCPCADYIS